jgi:hypothetical protein
MLLDSLSRSPVWANFYIVGHIKGQDSVPNFSERAVLFLSCHVLDRFWIAEVLCSIDLYPTVSADEFWVLVKFVDLLAKRGGFKLAHMQFTMFLRI